MLASCLQYVDELLHICRCMGQLFQNRCAIGRKIRLYHVVIGIMSACFFQPCLPIRQGLLIFVYLENNLLYFLFLAIGKRLECMQKRIPFLTRRQGEKIVEYILQRCGAQHQAGSLIQQAKQGIQVYQIKVAPRQLDTK